MARLADELHRKTMGAGAITMCSLDMKNFFSTLKLFRLLRERDIGAKETVRSNAGGFPQSLAVRGRIGIKLD